MRQEISGKNAPKNLKIGIVVSQFNELITQPLLEGAYESLTDYGVESEGIVVAHVPGALEIPLALQRLAQHRHFDGLIALGAVIEGETHHFNYVCQQVSDGVLRVSLDRDVPITFGVLTASNVEQAKARAGGAKGNKGQEAASALLQVVGVLRNIERI